MFACLLVLACLLSSVYWFACVLNCPCVGLFVCVVARGFVCLRVCLRVCLIVCLCSLCVCLLFRLIASVVLLFLLGVRSVELRRVVSIVFSCLRV